jgi:hypothetical protein
VIRALLLALLLASCAQPWSRTGSTQQEFYSDHASCLAQAGPGNAPQIAQANDPVTAGYNAGAAARAQEVQNAIYESCMLGKGWRHGGY